MHAYHEPCDLAAGNDVRSRSVFEAAAHLFQMDVIHGLALSEIHPVAVTTAYGPLADFLTIARGEQSRP